MDGNGGLFAGVIMYKYNEWHITKILPSLTQGDGEDYQNSITIHDDIMYIDHPIDDGRDHIWIKVPMNALWELLGLVNSGKLERNNNNAIR